MFRNYWVTATRNLLKQPLYSAINILGLAAGLACCILIALFVHYELSFDRHWTNADRLYRVDRDYFATGGQEESHLDAMPAPAAPLIEQEFPEVERAARLMCCGINGQLSNGDSFTEEAYADADNALFDVFDFEWVSGDPATALIEPLDLVLTESAARKYFGAADPMGQTLLLQWGPPSERLPRVVKGVIKDLPENSHLSFEMLGSMLSWLAIEETAMPFRDWDFNAFHTYVLLRDGADIASVQDRSGEFFDRHFEEGSSAYTGFTATAVPDLYLAPERSNIYNNQLRESGSLTNIYTFSAIGLFILLLACINFINLSTACSVRRGKEIGVRKAMGASGGGIGLQFFAESTILVVLAVLLSLALVELALPYFNAFMFRNLSIDYVDNTGFLAVLTLLVLATSVIAASYPAFYLARFQAIRVLRGDMTRGAGGAIFRKTLVTLQFSIAIVLIVATAVVYTQMRFARNVELGYETSRIVLSGGNVHPQRWPALKTEWLAHPEIQNATISLPMPFFQRLGPGPAQVQSQEGVAMNMGFMVVDYDFFDTYNIGLTAGRTFSADASDRPVVQEDGRRITSFIINERAARQFGWTPEEAFGKWLNLAIPDESLEWGWAGDAEGQVVGVVKDVYWQSVHSPLEPLVYRMFAEGQSGVASIRISGANVEDTLTWIDQKWKELGPSYPIRRSFLEQDFAALYETEQRQAEMLAFFSVLALVISCLGLFGLAAFMAERRTREIGVRKVMGGSAWSIVLLLTNDFSKLVLLSNLIAWPVAYFAMDRWLQNFAYRIDLTPMVFIGSGLIALCVAWVTVGGTAAKAASQKPVLALRYE